MIQIRQIPQEDLIDIRHSVLRANGERSECYFDGDNDLGVFHLGLYSKDSLVCVASFYPENNPSLKANKQYRLRGMATMPSEQSKGYGAQLIRKACEILEEREADLLWCNARASALSFYKKHGFETTGDEFEIKGIGPHYVCTKRIEKTNF